MANNQEPIANDPRTYLSAYITLVPSKDALIQLAGPVAAYMKEQSDPTVAAIYLTGAARHMGMALPTGGDDHPKQRSEVLEAIGAAATKCEPRNAISHSGVLVELRRWVRTSPGTLTDSHVEFLQCCVLAGQYRYARRAVGNEWPRPTKGVQVTQTLRYYYLRGLVHMGCEEWQWAVRCFWTCLSIPHDGVSAITIVAWKRLALCQCLLDRPTGALPPTVSAAVSRFLTTREGESQNIHNYRELVKAFEASDMEQFHTLQQIHAGVWVADRNTGMVERLATEILHRRVRHLASIYSVISSEQLSEELQVSAEDVPLLLSQVVGCAAKMDPDGMFSLELTRGDGNSMEGVLELMDLVERVRRLDMSVASSSRYQHLKDGTAEGRSCFAGQFGPLGVGEL